MVPRKIKNRMALVSAYLLRRTRLPAMPFEIQIGITNRCNLDCVFCPQKKSRRPKGVMDLDLLDGILDQVSAIVDTVDLSFDGEPFLHPGWADCVESCHRHGIRPMLETNAMLLDESLSRELLKVGVASITFSIDAATPETYFRLKPLGDYGRVVANVERFLRLAKRGGSKKPYIQIQFVRTPENTGEAEAFLTRWRGKGADAVHVKPMLNFGGSVGSSPGTKKRVRPCLFLWSSLAIQWDGVVPLCCLEIEGRSKLGDASRQDLRGIVNNQGFIAVRRLHAEGRHLEHSVCRGCEVPSVAWPFVVGSAFVGDLTRRKLINWMEKFRPL